MTTATDTQKASTSTLEELILKVANKTATASDYTLLATLSTAEATEKKKVEKEATKIVEDIKAANIDPQLLTNLLASHNLIVLPEAEKPAVNLFNVPYKNKNNEDKIYKWNAGKKAVGLTAKYFEILKKADLDQKKLWATKEGKEWLETEEGKNWLKSL